MTTATIEPAAPGRTLGALRVRLDDRAFAWIVLGFLVLAVVAGGSSSPLPTGVIRVVSAAILGLAAWRLAGEPFPKSAVAPSLVLAAALSLTLLQLVPLPPDIWRSLPGRQTVEESYRTVGMAPPFLPLSMTPRATWDAALGLLPPAAMFFAVLSLDRRARRRMASGVVILAVVSVGLGALQLAGGEASGLRFYAETNRDAGVGFFANRNHQAAFLVCAVALSGLAASRARKATRLAVAFRIVLAAAMTMVLVVGLGVARSRAGVLLLAPALLGSLLAATRGGGRWKAVAVLGGVVAAGGLVAIFSFGPLAERFGSSINSDDRSYFTPATAELGTHYAPFGSGVGSFRRVYAMHEPVEILQPTYVNHAHNEYVEVWLETGVFGVAILGLFAVWWLAAATRIVGGNDRRDAGLATAGALVVGLLLAHSAVDYPLRTPALATLLAMACGLMIPARARSSTGADPEPAEPRVRAPGRRLGRKDFVVMAICAVVGWAAVSDLVRACTYRWAPETALARYPNDPRALDAAAGRQMDSAQNLAQARAAAALARRALRHAPLDVDALQVLAIEAERSGQLARANALMTLVERRTRRNVAAELWLLDHSLRKKDYARAFVRADMLMRLNDPFGEALFPALVASMADQRAVEPMVRRLAFQPEWRSGFLSRVAGEAPDVAQAQRLFRRLAATRAPPTVKETMQLVDRLVKERRYVLAREMWSRVAPASVGERPMIYDAAFVGLAGPPPFNWRLASEAGVFAQPALGAEGGHALHTQYPRESANQLAEQLLILPPGAYRLSGSMMFEEASFRGAASWSLGCDAADADLAAVPGTDHPAGVWRAFAVDFQVPAEGCGAQWLRLKSAAQDGFGTEDAWSRSLRIVPLAATGGVQNRASQDLHPPAG